MEEYDNDAIWENDKVSYKKMFLIHSHSKQYIKFFSEKLMSFSISDNYVYFCNNHIIWH